MGVGVVTREELRVERLKKRNSYVCSMKRELYDLTDEPLTMFVNRVGEVLREEGIEHNVVGGISVQAYLLKMLTGRHNSNICDLVYNPNVRIQDYLRSTDDIDLALKLEESTDTERIKRINSLLPRFAIEESISPCAESIIEIKPERIGAARPTFRVYVDERGSEEGVIAMNISRGNKGDIHNLNDSWYDELIRGSQELVVPYTSDYSLRINVPTLEHLLATKISGSRAKDLMDNKNLVDLSKEGGVNVDLDEIERLVLPENQKKYFTFLEVHYPERLKKHGLHLNH